jgi:hypothetical protein
VLKGEIVTEEFVVKRIASHPPALIGFVDPVERPFALSFFSSVAHVAVTSSTGPEFATHLEYILDKCIWGVTTCSDTNKHNTRYASAAVCCLIKEWQACFSRGQAFTRSGYVKTNGALFKTLVRHEHVVTRESLRRELLKARKLGEIEELLRGAIACLVTKRESEKLNRHKLGSWERYEAEQIQVWDRRVGGWMAFPVQTEAQ